MLIQFDEILESYSENGIHLFRKYLSDYIACFYVDINDVDRVNLLEKTCDYVMAFEFRNKKIDSSIPELYVGELLPVIDKVVKVPKKDEVPCQAYRYVERAHEISFRIKKNESDNVIEDLEDFTKIFLCIYDHYLKNNREKVETIDFKMRGIGFDYIRTDLVREKRFKFLRRNNKLMDETIHNVLYINEKNNIYNTRNFAVMVLSLFYIRLNDLEGC